MKSTLKNIVRWTAGRAGRLHAGSPMPWQVFQRMSDNDLRAIYRYLQTVPAAAGGPDPVKRDVVAVSALKRA